MFTRQKATSVPEVGERAPGFNLPSAQGGKLVLSMRTVRGPVIVVFYRPNNEDDIEYFKALAAVEDEVNLAAASIVGVGIAEPDEARTLVRESGIKSYVLYDYVRVTSREWGLYEKSKELGEYSRPAVFVVGMDHDIVHSWTDERPEPGELLAKITEITGLPKPPEEPEEEPAADEAEAASDEAAPKKLTAENREKIKAERRAAREAGQSLKTGDAKPDSTASDAAPPKKLTAEEREKIKAERRAAREAGQSLKKPPETENTQAEPVTDDASPTGEAAPKKMSKEERERVKAERRAARESGESLKKSQETASDSQPSTETETEPEAESGEAPSDAPKKMSKEEREKIKAERRAAREAGESLKKTEPKSEEEG